MPEDFENKIIIKHNVGEMLDKRISNARTFLPDVVAIGGVTDAYQPAESKFNSTRQCLEILAKHRYPVHLVTKSTAVLRDLELLEEIGRESWCCVSLTITGSSPETARFLDSKSPPPAKRFAAIKEIKERARHIQTGVLLIPLIPYLCDSDDDLEMMVKLTEDSGADYFLFGGGMTLRDRQALWFLQHLGREFPELISRYEQLYDFKYTTRSYNGSYSPPLDYLLPKHERLFELCRNHQIKYRIPRFVPEDYRKANYLVAETLLNQAYEKQLLGEDWQALFWAGQNIQNLQESIVAVAERSELGKIRNVTGRTKNKVESLLNSQNIR
jgi:DNA repair photolyase